MSVKQFKFVSPGVFINEIDNSALDNVSDAIGPTIIGRLERGPSMRPIQVQSYSEFINIFGEAMPGGDSKDVWRNGNYTAPTYAAYAAQAYLRNGAPVNIVRLLGAEDANATTDGKAGWKTAAATYASALSNGGAYGLYILPSGSAATHGTGSLAAVWYCESGHIALTGTTSNLTVVTSSMGGFVASIGTDYGFKAQVKDSTGAVTYTSEFNFNEASDKYIRKVFNTNPTLTNSAVGSATLTSTYWLGESFENWLSDSRAGHSLATHGSTAAGGLYGVILPLENSGLTNDRADHQKPFRSARSPYVFAQDLSNDTGSFAVSTSRTPSLFKFETINAGAEEGQKYKLSIEDIRESSTDADPYGSFAVVVRMAADSDNAVKFVERFSNCNLNPVSENYVARKIGDKYLEWDSKDGRYKEYGKFNNQSSIIRVVMDDDVDTGLTDERLLPAGFRGPAKYEPIFMNAKSNGTGIGSAAAISKAADGAVATDVPVKPVLANGVGWMHPDIGLTASFVHPGHLARNISSNAPSAVRAFFGYTTTKSSGSSEYSLPNIDYGRAFCVGNYDSQFATTAASPLTNSFVFTLDDLSGSEGASTVDTDPSTMYWANGSRAAGNSFRGTASFGAMLKKGFDQFTLPLFGGNNGLNVKEMEPFRNSAMSDTDSSATNYAIHSVQRAVQSVADPEVVDTNMITMPGLTHQGLITRIIRTAEDRADALAIVDLKGGYQPNTEATGDEKTRRGSLDSVVSNLEALQENSSYACAYYPWVQVRDPEKGALLWAPPSVAALGVFANTEAVDELWFAPAGFNRGGLSQGAAGIPVVGTSQRLTSKERDNLYDANINPIANFPNEGIVVFGQKTLQVTPSALDRINVRRLMNYVKKEISRMANNILFQPNVEETWINFTSQVEPFLAAVRARFGLDDFKVVLDRTTTTPELIDRNIVYAKIFLKPTKAIEYIAIDFNITNSGASFED
jgi:phage tail sheath protein FI